MFLRKVLSQFFIAKCFKKSLLFYVNIISISLSLKEMLHPDETGVLLHPYLSITATSLYPPFSSDVKVAVALGFDCTWSVRKRAQITEV